MASPYVRHDSQIAVGLETTQGSAVTPSRTFGKINGDTDLPDPEVDWQEERSISGAASRMPTAKYPGQNVYEGGSVPIHPVDGFPIALFLGADSTTADTGLDSTGSEVSDTGTTLHTITPADGKIPPTLTIEAAYYGRDGGNDFVRTFTGATPGSGTVSVDNEGRLTTDLDMVAMGVSTGSTPTSISEDTRDPWMFHDTESDLSIAGTSYARVDEFEWELGTNAEPKHYLNSSSAQDPFEVLYGNAEPSLSASITPVDDSLYQELRGRSDAGSASIQFYRASSDERLLFEFGSVGFEETPVPMPEEGDPSIDVSILFDDVTVKVEDTQTSSAYV